MRRTVLLLRDLAAVSLGFLLPSSVPSSAYRLRCISLQTRASKDHVSMSQCPSDRSRLFILTISSHITIVVKFPRFVLLCVLYVASDTVYLSEHSLLSA